MPRFLLVLCLLALFPEASQAFGPFRRRASKPNADFLFDALDRERDRRVTREEFQAFLDPPRFRSQVLRQVRHKMGFLGKLPGMQEILERSGGEPPFARRNHQAWVDEHDRDGDGELSPGERLLAVRAIFRGADADESGWLDREEFRALLRQRQEVVGESPPESHP